MTLEEHFNHIKRLMEKGYGAVEIRSAPEVGDRWPEDNYAIVNICVHPGRAGEGSYICLETDPTSNPSDDTLNYMMMLLNSWDKE